MEINIDLDSLQSGKRTPFSLSLSFGQYCLFTASLVSGILVSREMITAIDYGSVSILFSQRVHTYSPTSATTQVTNCLEDTGTPSEIQHIVYIGHYPKNISTFSVWWAKKDDWNVVCSSSSDYLRETDNRVSGNDDACSSSR